MKFGTILLKPYPLCEKEQKQTLNPVSVPSRMRYLQIISRSLMLQLYFQSYLKTVKSRATREGKTSYYDTLLLQYKR